MKITLCNEVLRDWPLDRQAGYAAALGYDGLEIAPFTLDSAGPLAIDADAAAKARAKVEAEGIVVSGLHWLLVAPDGLSITDPVRADETDAAMAALVDLCAALGGRYLIHGSPGQRAFGGTPEEGRATALKRFRTVAPHAERMGVDYLLEPLSAHQTAYINTIGEATEVVRAVESDSFATMLDCCSAAKAENCPIADVLAENIPSGLVRHVHFNDPNLRGPGQGMLDFGPIVAALAALDYDGWIGVEPFDYVPDGPGSAARAIGTIRALESAQTSFEDAS